MLAPEVQVLCRESRAFDGANGSGTRQRRTAYAAAAEVLAVHFTVRLFLIALLGACGGPPAAPDAGTPSTLDSGPPPAAVCEGLPVVCSEHSGTACQDVPGCRLRAECEGFTSCGQPDRLSCERVNGCRWDVYCTGTANSCSTYPYDFECEAVGCDWVGTNDCEGSARACASLSASECLRAPGCHPIGTDAGVDGGAADDAGARDAGACDPSGARDCHAYFDRSCGCDYSTSDSRYACGRSGTVSEGGSCSDFGQCAGGLFCHRGGFGDAGECRARCASDAECDAGEACAFIDESYGGAPCTGFCLPVSECSFAAQDCSPGEGCYLVPDADADREYAFCHPAGSEEAGGICFSGNSIACQPGLLCAQDPITVVAWHCQPLCTSDADCDVLSDCTGMTAGFTHCR